MGMSKINAKKFQEVLGNCNYAVEVGKKLNFVLVGIGGSGIMEGNKVLTLALVWQLMRAYTLSLLSKLNEDGKISSIKHFQDRANQTALPIIDLIDAMNK